MEVWGKKKNNGLGGGHGSTNGVSRSSLACLKHRLISERTINGPINSTEGARLFFQPRLEADSLAAATAPADGKSELRRRRSLIIRTRKKEQFVFFAIRQIAGVGGGGVCVWGGSHMDFELVWLCFNDLMTRTSVGGCICCCEALAPADILPLCVSPPWLPFPPRGQLCVRTRARVCVCAGVFSRHQ